MKQLGSNHRSGVIQEHSRSREPLRRASGFADGQTFPVVVTREAARSIAREYLAARSPNRELVILDEEAREEDFGWVFFYDSARHIESGAFRDSLAGNAPLVVLRDSGALHVTGTARPIDEYLERFRPSQSR